MKRAISTDMKKNETVEQQSQLRATRRHTRAHVQRNVDLKDVEPSSSPKTNAGSARKRGVKMVGDAKRRKEEQRKRTKILEVESFNEMNRSQDRDHTQAEHISGKEWNEKLDYLPPNEVLDSGYDPNVLLRKDYFQAHSRTATTNISNRNIQDLEFPSQQETEHILRNCADDKLKTYIKIQHDNFFRDRAEMLAMTLQAGFNLIFYGYGSKLDLINQFAYRFLTHGAVITLNAYQPSTSLKNFLLTIMEELDLDAFPGTWSKKALPLVAAFISNQLSLYKKDCKLYLVIHNIDSASLRSTEVQEMFSILASSSQIFVVSSVDNVNASLLWDGILSARFQWYWTEIHTFQPYTVERAYNPPVVTLKGSDVRIRGAVALLQSLTENANRMFWLLAQNQFGQVFDRFFLTRFASARVIDTTKEANKNNHIQGDQDGKSNAEKDKGGYNHEGGGDGGDGGDGGVDGKDDDDDDDDDDDEVHSVPQKDLSFHEFYEACHEYLLVNNPRNMTLVLNELQDHELVTKKMSPDRKEMLHIPLTLKQLKKIYKQSKAVLE